MYGIYFGFIAFDSVQNQPVTIYLSLLIGVLPPCIYVHVEGNINNLPFFGFILQFVNVVSPPS